MLSRSLTAFTLCLLLPLVPPLAAAPAEHEEVLKRWSGKSPAELRAAAEAGNAEAQHSLAHSLFKLTNATPAQLNEGIQWLERAAEQKLAVAQAGMGTAYFTGKIVVLDFPKAWTWMRAAAAQELPYALNYLGIAHLNGWGTRADPTEAARWYQAAADKGYPAAMHNLSWLTERGLGGLRRDQEAATKLLHQAADAGHAQSQAELGWRLRYGLNGPYDLAAAVGWFRKSADQGFAPGQVHLGHAYALGFIGTPDLAAALALYRKAADQGSADGAFALAELYASGEGTPRDAADSANALYERAAEGGNHSASARYAERLRWGYGGVTDRLKACGYYCSSLAGIGSTDLFGLLTHDGRILPNLDADSRRFAELFQTHRRACQNGDRAALLQMGRWCADGTVGPADLVEAFKWFSLAAARGDAAAQTELGKVRARLTPEQLRDAEGRVAKAGR